MSTELVVAHAPSKLQKFVENYSRDFGDEQLRPDRVKIPSGGGTTWEVPGDNEGETESTQNLEGVWVFGRHASSLYFEKFEDRDPDQKVPDAYSIDGKTQIVTKQGREKAESLGIPIPGENLLECPYSQWGSPELLGRKGKGKANSDYYQLFLLRAGSFLPIQVNIPATSIKGLLEFKRRAIAGRGHSLTDVVINLALKKEKSAAGIEYAEVVPSIKEVLPDDQANLYGAYAQALIPALDVDPWAGFNQGHDEEFVEVEPVHVEDPFGTRQELGDLLDGVEIT